MRKIAAALVFAAACGPPTTPDGYPRATGLYAAFWSSQFTSVPAGVPTTGGPCPVTITITTQQGGTFQGESERGSPCVRGSQQLRGTVETDGRVVMDLVSAGFQGFDLCRRVAGDERWRGTLRDRDLQLDIDVLLECEGSGRLQTRSTITAGRVPD